MRKGWGSTNTATPFTLLKSKMVINLKAMGKFIYIPVQVLSKVE